MSDEEKRPSPLWIMVGVWFVLAIVIGFPMLFIGRFGIP